MRDSRRGGGIGLEPVYATDATLNVTNGTITAGSISGKVGSETITDGTITSGTFSGTVTLTGDNIKTAIEGVDISQAKVGSDTNSLTIGTLATNTQKISYVATTGTTVDGALNVNGGITIAGANGAHINLAEGTVLTTLSVVSPKFYVDANNAFANNSLKVGNGTDSVTITNGGITATGALNGDSLEVIKNATVGGDLIVAGTSTFEGANGLVTINNAEIKIEGIHNESIILDSGYVKASGYVEAPKFSIDSGNFFMRNEQGSQLLVSDSKGRVNIGGGTITASGDVNVGGDLYVGGTSTFKGKTEFKDGINTDKIEEATDDAGVTVDGVVLKDGGITATGNVTTTGDIQGKDINATGALKGQTLGIGGAANDQFTVDANGAVKAAGGKVEIDKTGKATFGENANNRTTIAGKLATFGENTSTDYTTINGGKLDTYDLTVRNDMTVKNFKADNITSTNRITVGEAANEVYLGANGTLSLGVEANQKLGKTQLANINDTIKSGKVIEANSATIDGVEIKGGNVTTATGTIQGNTISDGAGATLTSGKITANEGKIGNVEISAAGEVTGVKSIKASTFKVDEENYLNGNGITAKGGKIGEVKIEGNTLNIGSTKLDKVEGITTNKLTIDGMTLTDTKLDTGTADFQVNGVTFNQGQVTAKAAQGFVAGTSSFKEGSLIVDANNKLEATSGLTTKKATVKGNLDVTGKATFGTAGKQTTIEGDAITTDTLKANKLILGASGDTTVEVEKDGSLIAAKGKFKVDKDGALKAADGAFTVAKDGKTNFKKDDNNLSSINGGNIWAKATDVDNHTSSVLQHDSKGLHVKGNKAGETSAFDFDAATGISTFTGQDSTTTTINGSAITSTKADGNTGVLDGSNLTLTNGDNKTEMTAGGATFTKDGKTTIISGDTITTGTLNVTDIVLGGTMYDTAGKPLDGKLSIGNDGHLRAANGNFDVKDDGTFKNTVGNTTLKTDTTGASMKFDNTAADGGVKSEVAVADGKAEMAVGANAAVTTTDGKVEIKGGTQTVTTTDKGTVFENTAHKDPFVENGATNTIINGNEITTGKITTDQLVITGQGNAHGNGSIAFGGNGTIKSDINDGNGKNTSFETKLEGVNTKVTDGTITTENNVSAAGNSNTVKQDDTHKSEFNQGLTSIGGVVTNGTVKIAQTLDGANGNITNEVIDKDGKSSKLVQNGTGLEYTDSAKPGNATRIDSSDVSIGSKTDPDKRINLSDLGQIDELDKELTGRDEYKNNPTAVGGINAEAAIRREEVARLDGRINDVNDRVNKVGAMAAAIASLKSIGYDPQAPSEFSIGLGQYKGETGVAMGFFHYPNKNFMINVSLSTAGGETMGGIGATWRFGHKSPQKLLEEQREAQAKKELAAAEKYQAAAKLAKEAQERAEYAAKLARQAQVSADNAKAAADATQAKHFG